MTDENADRLPVDWKPYADARTEFRTLWQSGRGLSAKREKAMREILMDLDAGTNTVELLVRGGTQVAFVARHIRKALLSLRTLRRLEAANA